VFRRIRLISRSGCACCRAVGLVPGRSERGAAEVGDFVGGADQSVQKPTTWSTCPTRPRVAQVIQLRSVTEAGRVAHARVEAQRETFKRAKVSDVWHSIHDSETFVGLLRKHGVTAVADVRSTPFSRFTPHFNQRGLERSLAQRRGASTCS
jgi:Protein of unknown function, DUF488